MQFSSLLVAILVLQQVSLVPLPRESGPDLRRIISDESGLKSVEVRYSVGEQLVILRASGAVFVQSTQQNVSLVPTCKGKVASADVRRLLVSMLDTQFFDLPRNSYLMRDSDLQDWRQLQVHSISLHTAEGALDRSFAAGKIGREPQEIPEKFAAMEKSILELRAEGIPEADLVLLPRRFGPVTSLHPRRFRSWRNIPITLTIGPPFTSHPYRSPSA